MFWSVGLGWPLLRAEGFFCNLDILYWGLGRGKLQFLIQKKFNFFFSCNFFSNFWSLKPWIRIGSGSGLVSSLKRWIRIRKKWIRIRNPGQSYRRSPRPLKENSQHFNTYTKILNFVIFLWVIFALPDSGSTDLIESGSNPDPGPKHWSDRHHFAGSEYTFFT